MTVSAGMCARRTLAVQAGQRIGRGVVTDPVIRTSPTPSMPSGRRGARLICDCGISYEASLIALTEYDGEVNVLSCGCLGRERRLQAHLTHGLSGHELYPTWAAMLDRCENSDTWEFSYYGGRGIRVCERWHDVRYFIADVEHEIGPRPEGLTLDRVRNAEGHYEPGNIRWATWPEQIENRRQPVPLGGGFGFAPHGTTPEEIVRLRAELERGRHG
jgi:hypothetical protein